MKFTAEDEKAETFGEFWSTWTACPRCKTIDPTRLAASNAWYRQEERIAHEREKAAKLVEALEFCTYEDRKSAMHAFEAIKAYKGTTDGK